MRKRFEAHLSNMVDTHKLYWKWLTTTIDFTKYDYLKLHSGIKYVGLPDTMEHTWANGWYSSEYNEALNNLLDLELVVITYDTLDEENE